MASEIRVNSLTNRSGLSTVSITDTGVVVAGMVTATDAIFTGDITATNGTFSGNVSVGGTLTYEDVTNIDSVGIITARNGLKILAGGANIVGTTTITHAEVTTAQFTGSYVNVDGNLDIADSIRHLGDTNTKIRFPAADTITAETAGTERLRISSSGVVGINKTSPSSHAQLDVVGSSYWPILVKTTSTAGGGVAIKNKDDVTSLYTGSGGSSWLTGSAITDGLIRTQNTLLIATNGNNERLRITSGGKIGIGITNPEDYDSEADDLVIGSGGADTGITVVCGSGVGSHGSIFFADGTSSSGAKKKGQIRYEQNNEIMSFHTNEQQRLTIDLNGNVTLGYAGNSLYFQNGFNNRASRIQNGGASGSANLKFYTNNAGTEAERLRIDDDGRVLVGPGAIATPKCGHAGIDIPNNDWAIIMGGSDGNGNRANNANKDARFAGAHYVNAEEPVGIIRYVSGASANELHMGGGSSLINAATQLSFYTAANTTTTGGTERLRIDSAGRLLHGTTSSSSNISAVFQGNSDNSASAAGILLQRGTATPPDGQELGNIYFADSGGGTGAIILGKRDGGTWSGSSKPGRIEFWTTPNGATSGNERLRIDSAGTIKCGTSAVLKAEINSALGGHQFISQCDDNNNGFEIYQQHGSTTTRNTFAVYANTGGGGAQELQFSIRGDGCVTKPKSPAFSANLTSGNLNAANYNNVIIFNNKHFDNSNSYNNSNGRFTAPIAGTYYFGVQIYAGFDFTGVRVLHSKFVKNGSDIASADMFGGSSNHGGTSYHPTGCGHMMIDLAVNDWVAFNSGGFAASGTGNALIYAASGTRFFGYLVG